MKKRMKANMNDSLLIFDHTIRYYMSCGSIYSEKMEGSQRYIKTWLALKADILLNASIVFLKINPSKIHISLYQITKIHIVASKLNDPICHSDECQIGSFSSEATIYYCTTIPEYIYHYVFNRRQKNNGF